MSGFKKLIMTIPIEIDDRKKFIEDCRTWEGFLYAILKYDKMQILKIIKYFITERRSAKKMLARAIGRFNTLNKLDMEDLK